MWRRSAFFSAPRAFAVLRYLVEHPGRLVAHDELLEALWPKTYVQPEVLKSHIAAIRTVLGDDARKPIFIETLSRRGYRFIAAVTEGAAARPSQTTNLPEAVSELIGREDELGAVTALATEHRLVSLVGAGGIGKTRLGMEVARHLLPRFPDGVFVAGSGPCRVLSLSQPLWRARSASRTLRTPCHGKESRVRSAQGSSCWLSTIVSM